MARHEDIAKARQTVAVIGGSGALGFGLSLRWAIAGVPILIGRAMPGGPRRRPSGSPSARARRARATPRVEGLQNEEAAARASTVVLAVPFRNQSETLTNLRCALQPQTVLIDATVPLAAADRRPRDAHARRVAGLGRPAGGGDGAARRDGGVGASHGQRGRALGPLDRDGRGRADRRRRPQGQGRRGRPDPADPRAAAGGLRRPRAGPDPRAADRAADLDQRPAQDQALRHPHHRPRPEHE